MSFTHRSPTDTEMYITLKILVCVTLFFTSTVYCKRADFIDLGTSILLPWETSSNPGFYGRNYGIEESSKATSVNNINNRHQNEVEAQQRFAVGDSIKLRNQHDSRKSISAADTINSNSIQGFQKQYSNGKFGQNLFRQNRYPGLSAYSTINSNPNSYREQSLIGRPIPRYAQNTDNSQNYQVISDSTLASFLGNQLYGDIKQASRVSFRPLNVASINSGRQPQHSAVKGYQGVYPLEYSPTQFDQSNIGLNQEDVRSDRRVIGAYNSGQNTGDSDESLHQRSPIRFNRAPVGQGNILQSNKLSYLYSNNNAGDGIRSLQSSEKIDDQLLIRTPQPPVAREQLINNGQGNQIPEGSAKIILARGRDLDEFERKSLNHGIDTGILSDSYPSYQEDVNQPNPNEYSFGELNGKIWKVMRSNPSRVFDVENLRGLHSNPNYS